MTPPGWASLPLARRARARALAALSAVGRAAPLGALAGALEERPLTRRAIERARRALAPLRLSRVPTASIDPAEVPRAPRPRAPATSPRISVIVPTRGAATLAQCLAALDAHTAERALEVVVVADGAPVEVGQPFVRTVRLASRRGFAGAVNAGARAARGEVLVILNDDAVVTPGWLEPLLAALELPRAGLAAPATNASGDAATTPAGYGDLAGLLEHAARCGGEPRDVPKLSLLCAAVPRELFAAVGGLDEGYGLGLFEDDELCAALRRRNRRVLLAPAAWVHHHESATFGRMPLAERIARFEINRHRFERRWDLRWRAPR